jgi:hypothetical protein
MVKEFGYANAEFEGIRIGGGNQEQNKNVIRIELLNISNLFRDITFGTQYHNPIPDLLKDVEEILEGDGGIEEIHIHLFHYELGKIDGIKIYANRTKEVIFN